jgi:hypothetical protein
MRRPTAGFIKRQARNSVLIVASIWRRARPFIG